MSRILFVDDDALVLDGLRVLLRAQRNEWEMVFANGGREALAELEKGRFDVVVSDMRMPEINGIALLTRVKERYPMTTRIVLSGHAEREAAMGVLPVSHQFLSKPCEKDVLKTVIERALGLQALLADEDLRSVIGQLDRLPAFPRTYMALERATAEANVSLAELARIVNEDPAIAVKILQIVNSSYFGLPQKHATLHDAVMYLGSDLLKSLALTAEVFGSNRIPTIPGFSLDALQNHSIIAARIAGRILSEGQQSSEAFTATLVHDIGKIVLALGMPDRFAEVIRSGIGSGRLMQDVEQEVLGVSHAEVGGYLLGLWGLPLGIVEAVTHHHHPERVPPTSTLVAVHVANALSHIPDGASADPSVGGRMNVAWVEGSAFGEELHRWRDLAENLESA